jgi:aminoglycoside 2'-N-acetyltransferase I
MPDLRVVATEELSPADLQGLREMLEGAFAGADGGGLTEEDWQHTLGGVHVLVHDQIIVSHAAVIARVLIAGTRAIKTGYVEGVATSLGHRRHGHASLVMREVAGIIQAGYEMGGLATGIPDFYTRLGWEIWSGPTAVRLPGGPVGTPDENGSIMVLRTAATAHIDASELLMCDPRPGDVW